MKKRLHKCKDKAVVFGVCAGLGDYLNIDPVYIRLIWLLFIFFKGAGIMLYLICAIIMPDENPTY